MSLFQEVVPLKLVSLPKPLGREININLIFIFSIMPWTLKLSQNQSKSKSNKEYFISVSLNNDFQVDITPKNVALFSLGMLIHDIAKPLVLGGAKHSILGYQKLQDPVLKEILKGIGIDDKIVDTLTHDDLESIREAVLLHHMEVYLDGHSSLDGKVIQSKLVAIFAHPFDIIASSVYGFLDKECRKKLEHRKKESEKEKEFVTVNPFTRVVLEKYHIIDNNPGSMELLEKYRNESRERTYEPACDISLYEHGRFAATLSFLLLFLDQDVLKNILTKFKEISEKERNEIMKNLSESWRLTWLVVDLTPFWSLISHALKPNDLVAFTSFVENLKTLIAEKIRKYLAEAIADKKDEKLIEEIIKIIIPLSENSSVIVALLPRQVAKACKDKLLPDLVEEATKKIINTTNDLTQEHSESWVDFKGEFENLLKNYIRISTHDVIFDTSSQYACAGIAKGLQQSLEKVLEVLSGVTIENLSQTKVDTFSESSEYCWYCGINPALEKIDTYRYGQTDIEIKACRVCHEITKRYATNESREFARISEGQKIGLIALIPNFEIFYSSWQIDNKRNIIDDENVKKLKNALEKLDFKQEEYQRNLEKYRKKQISFDEFRKSFNNIENINEVIQLFENEFPIDSWSASVYLDDFIRDLRDLIDILKELEVILKPSTQNEEQQNDRLDIYYELLFKMSRIFEKKKGITNTISFIVDSISPLYHSFLKIKDSPKCLQTPFFLAHPARLASRADFWMQTLQEIKEQLEKEFERNNSGDNSPNILIIPKRQTDHLFIVVPGKQLYGVLNILLEKLKEKGFILKYDDNKLYQEILPVDTFVWEILDVPAPAVTVSIFLADGKFPLYRLLRTAFTLARKPFEPDEKKHPLRYFYADLRSGFDPSPFPWTIGPIWLMYLLKQGIIDKANSDELKLAHNLILQGGYEKARESIIAFIRRGYERGFTSLDKALLLEGDRLTPSSYYILANLINLKRYSMSGEEGL